MTVLLSRQDLADEDVRRTALALLDRALAGDATAAEFIDRYGEGVRAMLIAFSPLDFEADDEAYD
jgi:hypothetical protein